MGNKFPSRYFRSVVCPVSCVSSFAQQNCSKSCPVYHRLKQHDHLHPTSGEGWSHPQADRRREHGGQQLIKHGFPSVCELQTWIWESWFNIESNPHNHRILCITLKQSRSAQIKRTIQVRVGSAFSQIYPVENGTPQGSVSSPILFNLMINDIFTQIDMGIGRSLYADDGALWKRGCNVGHVEKCMQTAVNIVENWASEWGF